MHYAVSEFKPILETPRPLRDGWEARGKLLSVFCRDGFVVATWVWGAVALPEDLESRLRELIGKEVCCLRLENKYFIREA